WVLGRSPDCDIALPMDLLHRDISRHHCAFEIDPPTVRVRDLNSLNGTYVNGEKIGQRLNPLALCESDHERATRELRDGDEVRVADSHKHGRAWTSAHDFWVSSRSVGLGAAAELRRPTLVSRIGRDELARGSGAPGCGRYFSAAERPCSPGVRYPPRGRSP